ncbi:exodeoxyribonuclease VII small subunit [Helicobacter enhydrae]|uniref:Exodeoxyribonuclease VII small subunit n=1 Tax=Helicobacter enhydrae TaxID=222136 RepID=A0A1B1U647_9HELI|nr:exodeoxyribonuclease VII small subunit [Helicobacter enhydrae]ANV98226.1 exodeoxyribonuclease VII small subunit [Helicobacter enhydrae]
MPNPQNTTKDFETLIEEAKTSLDKLNTPELSLKESLAIYTQGIQSLEEAQKLLEEAKLQYTQIQMENQ